MRACEAHARRAADTCCSVLLRFKWAAAADAFMRRFLLCASSGSLLAARSLDNFDTLIASNLDSACSRSFSRDSAALCLAASARSLLAAASSAFALATSATLLLAAASSVFTLARELLVAASSALRLAASARSLLATASSAFSLAALARSLLAAASSIDKADLFLANNSVSEIKRSRSQDSLILCCSSLANSSLAVVRSSDGARSSRDRCTCSASLSEAPDPHVPLGWSSCARKFDLSIVSPPTSAANRLFSTDSSTTLARNSLHSSPGGATSTYETSAVAAAATQHTALLVDAGIAEAE
mmetsp:Transcript_74775/g.209861  ORF Transcript_74775/g.209861 Transcript_74775/m.209861 type:complete len:300 (+) Transcript_74775:395-1294(+)